MSNEAERAALHLKVRGVALWIKTLRGEAPSTVNTAFDTLLSASDELARALSDTARASQPDLPEPAFWVAEEPKRHGMHPAYRSSQARQKYGGEGVWWGLYTGAQVDALIRAALSTKEPQP